MHWGDLSTNEIRRFTAASEAVCTAACLADPSCRRYNQAGNGQCYLFSTIHCQNADDAPSNVQYQAR